MSIALTDYGARWVSANVPAKDEIVDVLLGFDTVTGYENDSNHLGSTIGRNANRISCGRFSLNNTIYELPVNDPSSNGNLHSGPDYYDQRIWSCETVSSNNSVIFTLQSPDMDQGFPGNLNLKVTYLLTEDNTVKIMYDALCDSYSLFNPTNHAYFNLNGQDSPHISNHILWIDSRKITESKNGIPTGNLLDVKGTIYDFTNPHTLTEQFDDNWCLEEHHTLEKSQLSCYSPQTGITLYMHTDLPGIQVYTGNFLTDNNGKNGAVYQPQCSVCFESQYYVDSINIDNEYFKKPIIKPKEPFHSETWYRFTQA